MKYAVFNRLTRLNGHPTGTAVQLPSVVSYLALDVRVLPLEHLDYFGLQAVRKPEFSMDQ